MNVKHLILIAILVAGAVPRFYGLSARSLWYDEAVSASVLDLSAVDILRRCSEPLGVHPPLYFLVLKGWATLFGDSDFALRSLAAVSGLLTIVGMYALVGESAAFREGPEQPADEAMTALLAAALIALNPLQIQLSQQTRGYTLGMALFAWGCWSLLRALRSGGRGGRYWILAAFLALAASYTHYLAIPSIMAESAFAIAYLAARRGPGAATPESEGRPSLGWPIAASAIFVCLYLVPWVPRFFLQSENMRLHGGQWGIRLEHLPAETYRALCSTFFDPDPHNNPLAWIVASTVCGTLAYLASRDGWRGRLLAMIGLLPPLLIAGYSTQSSMSLFSARYLCFAQLGWIAGFAVLVGRQRSIVGRGSGVVGLVALSALACYASWGHLGSAANPGMRAAIGYVLGHRRHGETIVARDPFAFFGAARYCRGNSRPYLCVAEADRRLLYGSEHLRDADLITADQVLRLDRQGVWLLHCKSFGRDYAVGLEIPSRWKPAGTWEFRPDYFLEGPIVVSHYEIEPDRAVIDAEPAHKAGPG